MQRITVATTALAVLAAGATQVAPADPASPPAAPAPVAVAEGVDLCGDRFKQAEHRRYVRAVYRRTIIRRRARARMTTMRRCSHSSKATRNMRSVERAEGRSRQVRLEAARARARAMSGLHGALHAIAMCESGGNPRAISPGGKYRGKYQFSYSTWASVGGRGDPAAASEAEQDLRAAILYRTGGPGHWPVCSR